MSARDWTSLLFRICGILLIIFTMMITMPQLLVRVNAMREEAVAVREYSPVSGTNVVSVLILLLGVAPPLLTGWMLVRRTDWFVDRAFQTVLREYQSKESEVKSRDEPSEVDRANEVQLKDETNEMAVDNADDDWVLDLPNLHRDDVLAIAISFMGVWVLSSALPELVQSVGRFFTERINVQGDLIYYFLHGWSNPPLYVLARTALGLWLFLWSYKIVTVWSKRQRRWKSAQVESGGDNAV